MNTQNTYPRESKHIEIDHVVNGVEIVVAIHIKWKGPYDRTSIGASAYARVEGKKSKWRRVASCFDNCPDRWSGPGAGHDAFGKAVLKTAGWAENPPRDRKSTVAFDPRERYKLA